MSWALEHREQIMSVSAMVEVLAWYLLAGDGTDCRGVHVCHDWAGHSRLVDDPARCRCLDNVPDYSISDMVDADMAAEPAYAGRPTKREG